MEYDPHIINVELMAGQAYTASANYFNALHRLEKGQLYAQDMFAPLTEHPRIAESLLCLGILNIDLGEYVTAHRFVSPEKLISSFILLPNRFSFKYS